MRHGTATARTGHSRSVSSPKRRPETARRMYSRTPTESVSIMTTSTEIPINSVVSEAITTHTDGTFSVDGAALPMHGYYVGSGATITGHPDVFDTLSVQLFVNRSSAPFIGVWTDTETGIVYLDETRWFESKSDALQFASARGELAIWDIANTEETRTPMVRKTW